MYLNVDQPRLKHDLGIMRSIKFHGASRNYACHFFDRVIRRCMISDTRTAICRTFNCDEERRGEKRASWIKQDGQ